MLNFPKYLKWISGTICFVSFPAIIVNAQFNPTEAAKGFNVITSGDFKANRDVEGGVAVGGRLTIYDNLQVNMHSSGTETFKDGDDANYVGLIVNDGVTYTSGKVDVQNSRFVKIKDLKDSKRYLENNVYQGILVHKDATGKGVYIQGNQNQSEASLKRDVSSTFNFTDIFNEFRAYSDALKNATANAEIESYENGNKYRFKLTAGQTNIINITKNQLYTYSSKGELGWTMAPSAATPVVINVDMQGGDFDWNNKPNMMVNGVSTGQGEFVLWNFYNGDGKTLKLNGPSYLIGSIYALGVSVEKYEGYVEGQIVAKDFYQNGGEVHYKRFKTTVTPPTPTECTGCKSVNLIYNPDFGSCPSPSVSGWEIQKSESRVSWGTFCHDFGGSKGNQSVGQLNWDDVVGNNYVRQKVEDGVVPLKSFVYTAVAATHHNYYNGQTRIAKIWIEFYNSSDQKIGGNVGEQFVTTAYSTFRTYTISGTIPANAKYLKIVGYANGTALKFTNNLLTIDCYDKINISTTKVDANCDDKSGKITVNTTGGSGQFQYRIKKGSAGWGSWQDGGNQYIFSNLTSATYTVGVQDKNTTSNDCKKEVTVTINKDSTPNKPSGVSDKSICKGESVTLPGSCTTGTLKWYVSDKSTVISGSTVSPTTTTTYYARCESSCNSDWADMKVTVNPLPTVSVNSGTICAGEKITLTATTTNCTGTITWTAGGQVQGTGTSLQVQPAANTTYKATCKNSNNCEGFGEGTVTVKPVPAISVSNVTICLGETAVLEAKNCTGTVTWNPTTGASGNKVTITPSAAGEISYTATCTKDGCTATATGKITVNPKPTVTVTNSGKITCTAGSEITATASPTTGVTYIWTVPSGVADPGSVASFTATVPGTYKVKVKIGTTGCESEEKSTTVTEDKTVPTVTVNNATLTCTTTTVKLTANGSPAGVTYSWTGPGGFTATTKEVNVTVAGSYEVTVTAANGCTAKATSTVTPDTNLPTVTVNNATLTCTTTTVKLTANGSPAGVTYSWTGPGGFTATTKEVNVTVAGSYEVTVTAANGCTAKATSTVSSDTDKPTVILETGKLTCLVTEVTVAAAATGDGITYSWTVPAGAADPGNVSGFKTSVPGVYTLVVTTANGCTASDTIEVQRDADVPSVTVGDKTMDCDDTEVTLTAESAATGLTYSWTGPDAFTAHTKEITVSKAGTYTVTVTALNGCTATDEGKVTVQEKPGPPTVAPQEVCYGEQITLTATCATGTPKWYSDAALTQEITVLTFVPQQTHTYYVVCATHDCVSEPTQAVVTVTPAFPAPVLSANPNEVIKGESSTLSGTCETGTLVWYKDAGLTQALGTGATLVVTPDSTTTYYAACEVDNCKKPAEIIVRVKDGIFDLALKKTLKAGQKNIFKPGDTVTFNITVYNQGNVDATDIDLVDYIPTGLTLNDPNWTLDGTKAKWSHAIPALAAGAQATVSITFTLNNDATGPVITNTAEISGAKNDKGLTDIDSTPDDNKDNDGPVKNDEINEDGKKGGDEDDHDIEPITICPDQKCLSSTAKVKK